jgi:hypothetical protein
MLVLNLRGGNTSEGALVQLWDDCRNEHNHWRFASYGGNMSFSIQSVTSGLYLSVPNGNSALGSFLVALLLCLRIARPTLSSMSLVGGSTMAIRSTCGTTLTVRIRNGACRQCVLLRLVPSARRRYLTSRTELLSLPPMALCHWGALVPQYEAPC